MFSALCAIGFPRISSETTKSLLVAQLYSAVQGQRRQFPLDIPSNLFAINCPPISWMALGTMGEREIPPPRATLRAQ